MKSFLGELQDGQGEATRDERKVRMMNPLTLAYMGDAVYEAYIRKYLIEDCDLLVRDLHRRAICFVRAKAQAEIVHDLMEELTQEEWEIVKRGRNQKSATIPKNAQIIDYKYATGFEALLGYLFLLGRLERLITIMDKSVKIIINKDKLD